MTIDVLARRKAKLLDQGFWIVLLAGFACLGSGHFWIGFVMVAFALILFGLWRREIR